MRRLLPLVLLLLLVLPAAAQARVPYVAPSPATGGPTTTFVLTVPKAIMDKRKRDYTDVSADYRHKRDRCTGRLLPNVKLRKDGSARVRFKPSVLRPAKDRWCTGTYTISVFAQKTVDDDDETGAGGVFDQPLARSSFRVR